jgi:hypothetical protein
VVLVGVVVERVDHDCGHFAADRSRGADADRVRIVVEQCSASGWSPDQSRAFGGLETLLRVVELFRKLLVLRERVLELAREFLAVAGTVHAIASSQLSRGARRRAL